MVSNTTKVLKTLQRKPEIKLPITNDMYLPNHSGVASHPEANKILAYGEIYFKGNSNADTVATATNTQLTRFDTNGVSYNTTPDHTNDHITINKTGKYLVNISISFSGTGSVDWTFSLYTNNGNTEFNNIHTNRKLGAGGDIGSASMSGICSFNNNDTVELWMSHAAGVNKDITVQDCTLSIVQVGL